MNGGIQNSKDALNQFRNLPFEGDNTMTRLIIPLIVALVVAVIAPRNVAAISFGASRIIFNCTDYLDAYAKSTLTGKSDFKGHHEVWEAFGYIDGYITGVHTTVPNSSVDNDVLQQMSRNDVRRWVASWCRDNPSRQLYESLAELIESKEK